MNIAQWQGWTTLVVSFNLAEPVSHRALLKNVLKGNTNQDKGGKNKQWQKKHKRGKILLGKRSMVFAFCCVSVYLCTHAQVTLVIKNLPVNARDTSSIPGLGRSPEGGHGNPHQCSCLENPPRTEEPGGLQCMGLQRVRHDWATKHSTDEQIKKKYYFYSLL